MRAPLQAADNARRGRCVPRKRNLDRNRVARLSSCGQIDARKIVVVISKTGCGENYLEQVLEDAACRKLFTVRRSRLADMTDDLNRH